MGLMKKMSMIFRRKRVYFFFILLLSLTSLALAGQKFLEYFPSKEYVDSIEKTYDGKGKPLGEIECSPSSLGDIFDRLAKCEYCVYTLKEGCPDCCLVKNSDGDLAVRCSGSDNSGEFACVSSSFNCGDYPFDCSHTQFTASESELMNDCARPFIAPDKNIPDAQNRGCPAATYEPDSSGTSCSFNSDEQRWECAVSGLTPKYRGCEPKVSIPGYMSKFRTSNNASDFYDIVYDDVSGSYWYTPVVGYKNYVEQCNSYAYKVQGCYKDRNCCRQDVCPASSDSSGIDNCNTEVCESRIDWGEDIKTVSGETKKCGIDSNSLILQDCLDLQSVVQSCLLDVSDGRCLSCFNEIDDDFYYSFVAHSGQSLVVLWQIIAEPVSEQDIDTYFYTMVKILDEAGKEVHSSIVHQKSFKGSFSIFSGTAIESGEDILEQGKSYKIRLYYFIPKIETAVPLIMNIKKVQMILMGARE